MPKLSEPTETWIGVDPGQAGGIAVITDVGPIVFAMPSTEAGLWEIINACSSSSFAVVEKVGVMPGNGAVGMFKFGRSVGVIYGMLAAAGIPFEEVPPRAWQAALGVAPRQKGEKVAGTVGKGKNAGKPCVREVGGEDQKSFKKRLLTVAQRLFPAVPLTLDVADALLIAEYCRRKHPAWIMRLPAPQQPIEERRAAGRVAEALRAMGGRRA